MKTILPVDSDGSIRLPDALLRKLEVRPGMSQKLVAEIDEDDDRVLISLVEPAEPRSISSEQIQDWIDEDEKDARELGI